MVNKYRCFGGVLCMVLVVLLNNMPSQAGDAPRPDFKAQPYDRVSGQPYSKVFATVQTGNTQLLAEYLDKYPYPDRRSGGYEDWRMIHAAIMYNQLEALRLLIDRGADVNGVYRIYYISVEMCDCDPEAPLHTAVRFNRFEAAQMLLEAGADIDTTTGIDLTPVALAAAELNAPMVRYLLNHGADPNKPGGTVDWESARRSDRFAQVPQTAQGMTPLEALLTSYGLPQCLNGGIPHVRDYYTKLLNETAGGWADNYDLYISKTAKIAQLLIADGATPDVAAAAAIGDLHLLNALLAAGADANAANDIGMTPLHYAAMHGRTAAAAVLLDHGADVNSADHAGWTPLLLAVLGGQAQTAELLLEHGADPDAPSRSRRLALWLAASRGDNDCAEMLLRYGAAVGAKTHAGLTETPLHIAAQTGNLELIRMLVEYGDDVNSTISTGHLTPLHYAARNGQLEAAKELIAAGADVSLAGDHWLLPLYLAARANDDAMVRLLLSAGAAKDFQFAFLSENLELARKMLDSGMSPNGLYSDQTTFLGAVVDRSNPGFTNLLLDYGADPNLSVRPEDKPLTRAALLGNSEVVKTLLARGANINAADSGRIALEYAIRWDYLDVAKALLNAGVDPNGASPQTAAPPLAQAVEMGRLEMIKLLVAHGADVNAQIKSYFSGDELTSVLNLAAHRGTLETCQALLDCGADVNGGTGSPYTPLFTALNSAKVETVKLLVDRGAAVTRKDSLGRTLLHVAAGQDHPEEIDQLIKAGADVDAVDKDGQTALHVAANRGYSGVIARLLASGASVNIRNNRGQTPLDVCLSITTRGDIQACAKLLVKSGADVDNRDFTGDPPLMRVLRAKHDREIDFNEIFQLLLKFNANTNALSSDYRLPLNYCAEQGWVDYVADLLAAGADVGAWDHGETALHAAAREGHLEVCRLLIDAGADVNGVSFQEETPLSLAKANDHQEVAELLTDNGAVLVVSR